MTALEVRIRSALEGPGPLWFEGLAPHLARAAWSDLKAMGVGPDTYSASRIISQCANCTPGAVMRTLDWGHTVCLEPFDGAVAATYGPLGLWAADADLTAAVEPCLADAMALLEPVAGAADAVKNLVWTIVPVAVESPDYDTGFSDPHVPFTVVLGAHDPVHAVPAIRLAEGLLHETMHLQLSLIEATVPLVAGAEHRQHSPWQHLPRPTQGLLHGLYVFRVVQSVLTDLLDGGLLGSADADHARRRIVDIQAECAELAGLHESADFTEDGQRFLARLQA